VSLDDWVSNGWLMRQQAAPAEVRDALAAAAADLADARKDLSPGWRFAIAYNAALRLGTAALGVAGYRATRDQKHYRTIAALPQVPLHVAIGITWRGWPPEVKLTGATLPESPE
jgi:hypothetical protein